MDLKFKDNSQLKLSPFTQLEYIESTGTQYIQTNFSLNLSNKIFCKIKENVNNSKGGVPFAATYENNKMFYLQYNNDIKFCYYNNGYAIQSVDTNVHEFTLNDNGKYYIDGVKKGTVTQQNINIQNFRIFDIYVPNTSNNYKFTGRIFFIKIYDGATLLHNFVPVKDSNNVVCMYDTISETFFYNQGTGDFIAGPEVPFTIIRLPDNIILKTTTLYHKNTPNVNGRQLLNSILDAQKTAEDVVLNRIRVDIGNVSGSLSELMQYAGMAGFNDNYEPQAKPRLVGTWTINDWYTQEQLTAAQAAFDGLTIIADPNYVIKFDDLAVQVLDPNEDNYNPAVAIILQGQNLGVTFDAAPISGQTGRWMLTKSQASAISTISNWFQDKTTVSDTNGIVSSDTTASYNFSSFDEFQYFIGTTSCNCANCTNLVSIRLPNTITSVNLRLTKIVDFYIPDNLVNCTGWQVLNISTIERVYIDSISHWELLKVSVSNFKSNHGYLLYVNNTLLASYTPQINSTEIIAELFRNCKNSFIFNNISSIETIDSNAFKGCDNLIINDWTNWNVKHYKGGCLDTSSITIPQAIINKIITVESESISKCNSEEDLILNNVITYSGSNFGSLVCGNISKNRAVTLGSSLSSINGWLYFNFMSCTYLHILASTPPTLSGNKGFPSKIIYVGDGSSAAHDDAILADYLADTNWATYSSHLDTWYNYLHPQS